MSRNARWPRRIRHRIIDLDDLNRLPAGLYFIGGQECARLGIEGREQFVGFAMKDLGVQARGIDQTGQLMPPESRRGRQLVDPQRIRAINHPHIPGIDADIQAVFIMAPAIADLVPIMKNAGPPQQRDGLADVLLAGPRVGPMINIRRTEPARAFEVVLELPRVLGEKRQNQQYGGHPKGAGEPSRGAGWACVAGCRRAVLADCLLAER